MKVMMDKYENLKGFTKNKPLDELQKLIPEGKTNPFLNLTAKR